MDLDLSQYLDTPEGRRLRLPKKVLYHYQRRGLIGTALSADDRRFLEAVNAVWTDRATLGAMLARHSFWDREVIAATWDLSVLQTRIFHYGLFGVRENAPDDRQAKRVRATTALVQIELGRCNQKKQNDDKIILILKRARGFLTRLKKRFGTLICPHCATRLQLEMSPPKGRGRITWQLRDSTKNDQDGSRR